MAQKKVLIPLPSYGFDPSEAAIPWKLLSQNKIQVVFATPKGEKANADEIMLRGHKLGIWKSTLMARQDAVDAYLEMEQCDSFCKPIKYSEAKEEDFDAILLPGGHDKRVKEYLESAVLQKMLYHFFKVGKPIAAICHGVVLLARTKDPESTLSVIYDYKITCLLKSQELLGYAMTRLWLKDYYLTYSTTVEEEVVSALSNKNNFQKGTFPLLRDDSRHLSRGFVVKDRNLLTARWPGDLYNFSNTFLAMINEY